MKTRLPGSAPTRAYPGLGDLAAGTGIDEVRLPVGGRRSQTQDVLLAGCGPAYHVFEAAGRIVIEIAHSDEAKARIIESAIAGAEVRVTQNAQRSGPLRKAIKRGAA